MLSEAECYARCYGAHRSDQVSVLRPARRKPRESGEELRRLFEQRTSAASSRWSGDQPSARSIWAPPGIVIRPPRSTSTAYSNTFAFVVTIVGERYLLALLRVRPTADLDCRR